jgi:hypothetical protein
MSAPNYSYKIDAFYLPLDAYYTGNEQDRELASFAKNVKDMVRQFVDSPNDVKAFANLHLNDLFSFRMSALKWLVESNIRLEDLDSLIENQLEPLKNDPLFSVLYQNVLFAIRVNMRSINALISPKSLETVSFDISELGELPNYSFTEFLNMISLTAPDAVMTPYVDWLISSLYIEFGIISTIIIYKEKLSVSSKKINELAAFTADSAQEFGAISKELIPSTVKKKQTYSSVIPNEFLAEQLFLAEQDIELL